MCKMSEHVFGFSSGHLPWVPFSLLFVNRGLCVWWSSGEGAPTCSILLDAGQLDSGRLFLLTSNQSENLVCRKKYMVQLKAGESLFGSKHAELGSSAHPRTGGSRVVAEQTRGVLNSAILKWWAKPWDLPVLVSSIIKPYFKQYIQLQDIFLWANMKVQSIYEELTFHSLTMQRDPGRINQFIQIFTPWYSHWGRAGRSTGLGEAWRLLSFLWPYYFIPFHLTMS